MKRILLACFLLTATCTLSTQQASAQINSTITRSAFVTKVNEMDTQIGAGNISAATTTWNAIHDWMMIMFKDTKTAIQGSTGAAYNTNMNYMHTQETLYRDIWSMKTNLSLNRAALHTKLLDMSNTIN